VTGGERMLAYRVATFLVAVLVGLILVTGVVGPF